MNNYDYVPCTWNEDSLGLSLGFIDGYVNGNALSVNNRGEIVGLLQRTFNYGLPEDKPTRAFIYSNNEMRIIGTFSGGYSGAASINDNGQVVGVSDGQVFIWNEQNGLRSLNNFINSQGWNFTAAQKINNQGQIIGQRKLNEPQDEPERNFFWDGNTVFDLGNTYDYEIRGLNDLGQIVGVSRNEDGDTQPFLWDKVDGFRNISDLVSENGWIWRTVADINNRGQIIVEGYNEALRITRVWILTPGEKEPLIFIPGVSGSLLDAIESDGSRTNLWLGLLQNHDRLTLDPNEPQANIIATDTIRTVSIPIPIPGTLPPQFYIYSQDFYRQILEKLINEERYVEYQVNSQPSRRTFDGCDISGQMANRPNLFVFAYDWRKSNIENAQALKEYVGCVRRFYPDSKVNILAHSMGGLLARRYIINNPTDHHVNKMVTIGSPWLGAPKAIDVLKTGNFGLSPIVWNSTIRRLGEFFKGMHELLPSRTYFDAATRSDFHLTNYGKPFKEEGWDVNGNGTDFENYDYDQTVNLFNQQHPRSNPGSANQLFHDTTGQDNWLGDTSGVKYFHIYGQQSYLNTPIQVIAKYRLKCFPSEDPENACDRENFYDVIHGRGDKTVPTISAERSFGPYYNLLPQNDMPFFSPNKSQDESVEHTKLTQNPAVQQAVINFLNTASQQPTVLANQSSKNNSANLTQSLLEPGAESIELPLREGYYVNLSGVTYVEIRDDLGNVNTPLEGGYMLPIPSVNYDVTGERSISITTPTEGNYTFTFRSGSEPIFLETIKGLGNLNPTEVVRYLDLNLPANVNAQFQVSSTEITDLRYDSDEDGIFETSVLPTSHTTGNAATDLTPPTIQINEIAQPLRQLVINVSDTSSGVRKIYYSFDGTNFREYLSSIALTRSQSGTIYTFADDNSANRSLITTYIFVAITDPVVTIASPSSGSVFPIGTSVNFTGGFSGDNCNSHTATWTFDNISQTGTVNEANGTVTTNYTFTSAGVYLVSLTVNNACGGTGIATTVGDLMAMVVIYDPDGGFVTGGGWINSPIGAYTPNPNLTGRASFGFTSKYQRGANVPTGNTEFQFRVADFNFKSTSYDWLVVGGARAQYKGSGTVNNSGNYGFLLTAIDGQINGGGGQDKFRIKIWDKNTNVVIYDNQIGTPDGTDPTTVIGGGSIIIHRQ